MRVGVIDYGVGNLGSVVRALQELHASPMLVTRPGDLRSADSLILPGVGNFADCARLLEEGGWSAALREEVNGKDKPLLGVCVGMQLLASSSAEGGEAPGRDHTRGLGFIPGRVEHLRTLGCGLRIPHVGWNDIVIRQTNCILFQGIPQATDFYFVHSYSFVPDDVTDVIATTEYGVSLTAAVRRGRIWGTQFHPEKSSRAGFRLLRNFIDASC